MSPLKENSVTRREHLQINGRTFHVIIQGEGPAVLFCHGFPDTGETWRSQMQAISHAGYRAVALDMRGFGESYAPQAADFYTSVHVAGDLVGILDVLDISSAVLVGHDWGADYAQRAAIMRPDRFTALVSLSIPFAPRGNQSLWDQLRVKDLQERYYSFTIADPATADAFANVQAAISSILYWLSASPPPDQRWDPIDPARHMLRPSPVSIPRWADEAYVRHTVSAFEKTGFQTGLNYYRAVQKSFDLTAAYKNAVLYQPSLYIWGADDGLCRFFHPETPSLEELRKTQPGLIDQIRLENVGHWIQHEAADRLNSELLKFLHSVTPR